MQTVVHDLRCALREPRKSSSFAFTVVLALGVGAKAIVFSVLHALVLQPLALPDTKQLGFINRIGIGDQGSASLSSPAYVQHRSLDALTALTATWLPTRSA
jgi:hypothetical protein